MDIHHTPSIPIRMVHGDRSWDDGLDTAADSLDRSGGGGGQILFRRMHSCDAGCFGSSDKAVSAMRLLQGLRVFILALWPGTVLAATSIQQSFESVPLMAWLVGTVLSTLGGATALMLRLMQQMENPETPIPKRLKLMVASQMLCSWLAGAAFFLLGLHFEWPLFLLCASVAIASFGGAKTLESLGSWLNSKLPELK